MYKLLLIEDEVDVQGAIVKLLRADGKITVAPTIKAAKSYLESEYFDIVLLDVELPDGDGYSLCAAIRQNERLRDLPVIFLTGRGEEDDKVHAFTLGAEDFLSKPFGGRELKARIQRTLKREAAKTGAAGCLVKGDLRFNLDCHRVEILRTVDSSLTVDLTAVEYKLLLFFAKHEDHVISRGQLIRSVWDDADVIDRTIDSHISRVRRKLRQSQCRIVPVHGEGYRFIAGRRDGGI